MKNNSTLLIIAVTWLFLVTIAIGVGLWFEFKPIPLGQGIEHIQQGMMNLDSDSSQDSNQILAQQLQGLLDQALTNPTLPGFSAIFLHPYCPCSAATISEIERMIARLPTEHQGQTTEQNKENIPRIIAIMYHSSQESEDWYQSASWNHLQRIPGLQTFVDVDGMIARAMGVQVSGETLAFDAMGFTRFHGGLTASRGHEGTNPGIRSVEQILMGLEPERSTLPAWGCLLYEHNELAINNEIQPGGTTIHGQPSNHH
jgi:hypothetical protein